MNDRLREVADRELVVPVDHYPRGKGVVDK